jgi:hypothetical protein
MVIMSYFKFMTQESEADEFVGSSSKKDKLCSCRLVTGPYDKMLEERAFGVFQ